MVKVVYTVGRFQPPTIGHKKLIEGVIDKAKGLEGGKAYVFVSSLEDADTNPLPSALKIPILKHMFPEGVEFVDTKTCKLSCGGPRNALAWLKALDPRPEEVHLAVGLDRVPEFTPAAIWGEASPPDSVFGIGKDREPGKDDADNMSGTMARKMAGEGDKPGFYRAVGYPGQEKVDEVEAVYTKINGDWWTRSQKRKTMTPAEKNVETRAHNKAQGARPAAVAGIGALAPPDAPEQKKRRKRGGDPQSPELSGFDADAEDEAEQPKGGRRRTYRRCRKCGLPKKPETQ
jgi:hypothetical protein